MRCAHLLNEPLQLVCELTEVAGRDVSEPTLFQTVAGQFDDLMVGEAEHTVRQRRDALWGVAADDLLNLLLHLSRGLKSQDKFG